MKLRKIFKSQNVGAANRNSALIADGIKSTNKVSKFHNRLSMYEPSFSMPSTKSNKIEAFHVDNLKINEEITKIINKNEIKSSYFDNYVDVYLSRPFSPVNKSPITLRSNSNEDQEKNLKPIVHLVTNENYLEPHESFNYISSDTYSNIEPTNKSGASSILPDLGVIKLRTKKPLNVYSSNHDRFKNRISNRYSMFEQATWAQSEYDSSKLNDNLSKTDSENKKLYFSYDEQDIPKSVKDRIKMFSK